MLVAVRNRSEIRVRPATTEILAWDLPCSASHSWTSFDQMPTGVR